MIHFQNGIYSSKLFHVCSASRLNSSILGKSNGLDPAGRHWDSRWVPCRVHKGHSWDLLGGFNPSGEKKKSKSESSPNRGENKKYLKPPHRLVSQPRTLSFRDTLHRAFLYILMNGTIGTTGLKTGFLHSKRLEYLTHLVPRVWATPTGHLDLYQSSKFCALRTCSARKGCRLQISDGKYIYIYIGSATTHPGFQSPPGW